jgi:hypothetical protein
MVRFDPATTTLLDSHDHPLRKEIDLLRSLILGVDRSIEEGVKWNTASFKSEDWFATLNGPKHVKEPMLILHAGAKARGIVLKERITDPEGLIRWLGNDRAQITFKDAPDIKAKAKALQAIVSAWIRLI